MCLMLDQFLWGHSSHVCDISCYVMKIMQGGGEGDDMRNFSYALAPILVNIELRFHLRTYICY